MAPVPNSVASNTKAKRPKPLLLPSKNPQGLNKPHLSSMSSAVAATSSSSHFSTKVLIPTAPRSNRKDVINVTTTTVTRKRWRPHRNDNNNYNKISTRRLWRSTAPRSQHPWQTSALKAATAAATAAAAAATPGAETATDLQNVYSLLSQLHRRNKNQHRAQKWWKLFTGLRRRVGELVRIEALLLSLSSPNGNYGSNSSHSGDSFSRSGRKAGNVTHASATGLSAAAVRRRLRREEELLESKRECEEFMREVLLPPCYVAFSSVVRDKQFAALGLVLIGVLARVGTVVGLPSAAPAAHDAMKVEARSIRQTGAGSGGVVARDYFRSDEMRMDFRQPVDLDLDLDLDLGEVVERKEEDEDATVDMEGIGTIHAELGENAASTTGTAPPSKSKIISTTERGDKLQDRPATKKTTEKKKKKKGKSAIDELFAGLI